MSNSAQESIRRYLDFLADPATAVDVDAIAAAEAALASAVESGDRLQELEARAALTKAKEVDGSELEQAFIADAPGYAAERGIPASAFIEMGVASDVLRRGGLLKGAARRAPGRTVRSTGAKRLSVEEIHEYINAMSSGTTFAITDVQESLGGSAATVRKAIDLMPSDKVTEVTDAAVIAKHGAGSRGRAPKVWARV